MESTERLKLLLEKYLINQLDQNELDEFEYYLGHPAYEEEIKKYLGDFFSIEPVSQPLPLEKKEVVLQHILGRRYRGKVYKINSALWKITVAAMLLCVGTIAFFKFRSSFTVQSSFEGEGLEKTIESTGAILTLADGSIIDLNHDNRSDIVNEAGLSIKRSKDGEIVYTVTENPDAKGGLHTLSTGNGQTFRVALPDGSVVHLNAASTITYSPQLKDNGVRKVSLSGEAFFDITKDKQYPFVVVSQKQEIKVLGTRFNVSAYNDEDRTSTVLFRGAVRLKSGQKIIDMVPGQQVLNTYGNLQVANIDTTKVTAWRSGYFRFEDMDIQAVMSQLSRWYGVEVEYRNSVYTNKINGRVSRNRPLDEVLMLLEASGTMKFKLQGRRVVVM